MARVLLFLIVSTLAFAEGEQQFANAGKWKVGYRTFGVLNAAKSNAVLFPTWFSGQSADLAQFFGPGKLVDTSKFFVIAVDALGNGVSSSPAGFTIRDMVDSQHELLTRHLGISHLHAVMGISMGGMQTFEWMVAYPDFMDRAAPIVGTPQLTSADLLLWQSELSVIETAVKSGIDPQKVMGAVAAMHQFALYTPEYRRTHTSPAQFAEYLASFEAEAGKKMTALDWAAQLRAMMSHDVAAQFGGSMEEAAARVKAKVLVVVAAQDHMVNPQPAIDFSKRIKAPVLNMQGDCGHMATSCESGLMIPAVRKFL